MGGLAAFKCLQKEVLLTTTDYQRFFPTVRSMLKWKDTVSEFLRCSIGDGKSANFWHDYWTDLGLLIQAFGQTGPRSLRLGLESHVCQAARNGDWTLPHARSDVAETLQIVLTTMSLPTPDRGSDRFLWRNGAGNFVPKFSSKATWHSVRESVDIVPWHKLVWFKEGVPRCSFVTRMAALSRLPTRDRLASWGMVIPLQCVLCSFGLKSHQHLHFQCPLVSKFILWKF